MTKAWGYPIDIRYEHGEYHAYSTDLPEAIAAGATVEEALNEMSEAFKAAVRGRMKDGDDLPPQRAAADNERHMVALAGQLAAKASVYAAWKASHLTKAALAERMGRDEVEVRRILDPDRGTKLEQLDEAARALGGRLMVSFEAV